MHGADAATPRRDVLLLLAGLGLSAAAPGPAMATHARRRIDVHYHHMTPEWLDAVGSDMPPGILAIRDVAIEHPAG